MKYIFTIILFISFIFNSFSQNSFGMDKDVIDYRRKMTIPPYGLQKVQKLIAAIQTKEDLNLGSEYGIAALTASQFKGLLLREKFTYVMIHAESTSQNCDIPEYQSDMDKRIFGQLLTGFDEATWSRRQADFLIENRDSVMKLIKESVGRSKRMGVNYKEAILEINGWEMIPFIIEYAKNTPKDKDALTLLNLLMKRGEYEDFIKSTTFKKLYGEHANYYSYLDYNNENQALIFKRAKGYYDEKKR